MEHVALSILCLQCFSSLSMYVSECVSEWERERGKEGDRMCVGLNDLETNVISLLWWILINELQ